MPLKKIKLPFSIREFSNELSLSWRVDGYLLGERIRRNFADRAEAERYCKEKNDEALSVGSAVGPVRRTITRLSDADMANVESALGLIQGRWPIMEVIKAGMTALAAAPESKPVADLLTEWLTLMDGTVSDRWHTDLRLRCGYFIDAYPKINTDELTNAKVRKWLDDLDLGQQSKANCRNALHRFFGWLKERGYITENPAGGIWIGNKKSAEQRASLPSIFTPIQAEAFMRACLMAPFRPMLGWASLCLFAGLRPQNEAEHAVWAEIKFDSEEISALGRKRGVKSRIFKAQPVVFEWLKIAKADGMDVPGFYSRTQRRKAVEWANAWLTKHGHAPIVWDEDIQRHTYASMRAGQGASIDKLAEEMGTSADMIYSHYRHPRDAAEIKAFWEIRPARLIDLPK